MAKKLARWERDGFVLRSFEARDVDAYWEGFNVFDPEGARLTGSRESYERSEVVEFFLHCVDDPDRVDFLLQDSGGAVLGESVINEIDWETRSANFRIALFSPEARGHGLGLWMTERTRDFAFAKLGLHRLELDVFSINPCAEHVYAKAGFRREGVLRDAVRDGNGWVDDILMALLEDEWREIVRN